MKLYDTVYDLLKKYPALRNSDKLLIWNVWGFSNKLNMGYITRDNFMRAISPESITRCRRKIQELYPELCSSKSVQIEKDAKKKQKGTFIFREELN